MSRKRSKPIGKVIPLKGKCDPLYRIRVTVDRRNSEQVSHVERLLDQCELTRRELSTEGGITTWLMIGRRELVDEALSGIAVAEPAGYELFETDEKAFFWISETDWVALRGIADELAQTWSEPSAEDFEGELTQEIRGRIESEIEKLPWPGDQTGDRILGSVEDTVLESIDYFTVTEEELAEEIQDTFNQAMSNPITEEKMTLYILSVDNRNLWNRPEILDAFDEEKCQHESPLFSWLNPRSNWVTRYIEGVQSRQPTAKEALMAVEATPDFPDFLASSGLPITVEKANGQILMDREGILHHIGSEVITTLSGEFAHEAFRIVPLYPIPDLQGELRRQAIMYIHSKMDEDLGPLGHSPGAAPTSESINEVMRGVEDRLASLSLADLDQCASEALQILARKHFGEE
jgi:hypothetical protein